MVYLNILSPLKNYLKQSNRVYLSSKGYCSDCCKNIRPTLCLLCWLSKEDKVKVSDLILKIVAKTAHLKHCLKVCDQNFFFLLILHNGTFWNKTNSKYYRSCKFLRIRSIMLLKYYLVCRLSQTSLSFTPNPRQVSLTLPSLT